MEKAKYSLVSEKQEIDISSVQYSEFIESLREKGVIKGKITRTDKSSCPCFIVAKFQDQDIKTPITKLEFDLFKKIVQDDNNSEFDRHKLLEVIKAQISNHHKIGESAGGSGHLSDKSIQNLKIVETKKIKFQNKEAFQSDFTFETATISEFTMAGEEHVSKYSGKIVFDKDLDVLDYKES